MFNTPLTRREHFILFYFIFIRNCANMQNRKIFFFLIIFLKGMELISSKLNAFIRFFFLHRAFISFTSGASKVTYWCSSFMRFAGKCVFERSVFREIWIKPGRRIKQGPGSFGCINIAMCWKMHETSCRYPPFYLELNKKAV